MNKHNTEVGGIEDILKEFDEKFGIKDKRKIVYKARETGLLETLAVKDVGISWQLDWLECIRNFIESKILALSRLKPLKAIPEIVFPEKYYCPDHPGNDKTCVGCALGRTTNKTIDECQQAIDKARGL